MKYAIVIALLLTGCASRNDNYTAYLNAVSAQNALVVQQQQKPLVEIKAVEGQQITGLSSITFYAPPTGGGQQTASIAPPPAQQEPWAQVLGTGLQVIGQVAGYKYGADVAIGVAGAIRDAGIAGYQYVQAPGTVTTNTNSGNTATSSDSSVTTSTTTTNTTTTNTTNTATNSNNPVTNPITGK